MVTEDQYQELLKIAEALHEKGMSTPDLDYVAATALYRAATATTEYAKAMKHLNDVFDSRN